MIPFYVYYSMFGFQRIGDLAWAAGDMRARGFLLGGTSGRTTLNGEGLQHEDGHSHILSATIPNCVSYDPTFCLRGRGDHAVTACGAWSTSRRTSSTTSPCSTRTTRIPAMPDRRRGRHRQGHVPAEGAPTEAKGHRVQLLGCGAILREIIAGAELLEKDFGIARRHLERDELHRARAARRRTCERWNLLHPLEQPRVPYVTPS